MFTEKIANPYHVVTTWGAKVTRLSVNLKAATTQLQIHET